MQELAKQFIKVMNNNIPKGNELPSKNQIGDNVVLYFTKNCKVNAEVISVHFYLSKVKYDLEIILPDKGLGETKTRIYNVDSCYVIPV